MYVGRAHSLEQFCKGEARCKNVIMTDKNNEKTTLSASKYKIRM